MNLFILLILSLVMFTILIVRNYEQGKEIKSLNERMNELEVRIVVRLEDRISSNEDSIQILEHAHSINAVILPQTQNKA